MSQTQLRVITVLQRIIDHVQSKPDDAEMFSNGLEIMLEDIHMNDGFGTEASSDPRGDFRNGQWSMERVEGIDE